MAALLLLVVLLVGGGESAGETLYVDDDAEDGGDGSVERPFNRIQDAINVSEDGNTVRVFDGVYSENLTVNRSVSLIGNGSENSILQCENTNMNTVTIVVDGVSLEHFRVSNHEYYAIVVVSSGNSISHNLVKGNRGGIFLEREASITESCDRNHIANNTFSPLDNDSDLTYFKGIFARNSHHNNVSNNAFLSPDDQSRLQAIVFDDANFNTISNNSFHRASYAVIIAGEASHNTIVSNEIGECINGIELHDAGFNTIENNAFYGISKSCIRLGSSHGNQIHNNTFSHSTSPMSVGIVVLHSGSNTIMNNSFEALTLGIFLEGREEYDWQFDPCRENVIMYNIIFNNSCGISVMLVASSSSAGRTFNNRISSNNIFNNSEFGVDASGCKRARIDASGNWWGHDSGPYHSKKNPEGKGDNVTDEVDFRPWLFENGTTNLTSSEGNNADDFTSGTIDALLLGLSILLLGNAAILAYAAHTSESFRFTLLRMLLPLYSRISEKNIEKDIRQQNIRGRIYQHIRENPGANFTSIKKQIAISNGTTIYHLMVLQREGFIRSSISGNRKLFWAKSDFPPTAVGAALSDVQRRIVALLEENVRMSRTDIGEELGVSSSALHRHLKGLEDGGLLVQEREGKGFLCSLRKEEA